jgi:DNA polymerase-3 subunit gamma/tau
MSVAIYFNEGEPLKLQNNILTVSFSKNHSLYKETLEKKENRDIIERAISELFNVNLRVNFILSQENKHNEDHLNTPFIKSALDMFGGRVIKEE